ETLELTTALFGALNRTRTPMGARLLRQWLLRPLLDPGAIRERQDAVEELVGAPAARDAVRRRLEQVGDIERLAGRAAMRAARAWIGELESRERTRTGIASLRVRYNRVFGYGIEVSHAQASRVPADYVRRQTLAGAERYVTAELREAEATVLGAEERIRRL